MEYYKEFSSWLDSVLYEGIPDSVIAINFNLYEGFEDTYDVQLAGCDVFDENDSDWACNAMFSTGENLFFIPRNHDIMQWKEGLSYISKLVNYYLEKGQYSNALKNYTAVGIGFVDGDIDILHRKTT